MRLINRVLVVCGPMALTSAMLPFTRDDSSEPVRAAANGNQRPAGTQTSTGVELDLEIRTARWTPDAENGPSVVVAAFAERGRTPEIPGPMLRVREGTAIRVSIRNTLAMAVKLRGFASHPAPPGGFQKLEAGETRELRFNAGSPGTYYYSGETADDSAGLGALLSGAFIVDPADAPARPLDRVFVISEWVEPSTPTRPDTVEPKVVLTINGKAWPNTERFTFTQGDSVRWRVINASGIGHPMHLHGFYYRMLSRGGWAADTLYSPDARWLANTEFMRAGGTMAFTWVPEKPGNWIFHCHFAFHVAGDRTLTPDTVTSYHGHKVHRMAGLVLGIRVNPRPGYRPLALDNPRHIRLLIQSAPKRFGEKPGFGFVAQEGGAEPALDSIQIPGPPLFLRRGEPVRITVVNHLAELSAVHWHGIELESLPDGVPGWSGNGSKIFQPIPPADSFDAVFIPPRSGTFIYHSHSNEDLQINSGMYAPLIVLDPGQKFDPVTDKIVIAGGAGPSEKGRDTQGWVNGSADPPPFNLTVRTTYRFHLINIHPDWSIVFALLSDTAYARWRPVAKDGADLPSARRALRPAYLLTGPGETADFEFTPDRPGPLRLEVKTRIPGWYIPVNVFVRAAGPSTPDSK